eukprot:31411-Pelagococcus_subviridis.AAC.5
MSISSLSTCAVSIRRCPSTVPRSNHSASSAFFTTSNHRRASFAPSSRVIRCSTTRPTASVAHARVRGRAPVATRTSTCAFPHASPLRPGWRERRRDWSVKDMMIRLDDVDSGFARTLLVPPPAVRDEEHVPGATHRDVASHVYYSRVLDVVDIREVDHGVPVVRVADGERVHALVRLVRGDEKHAAAADDLALRVEGPSFKANVGVELKGVRSGVER